MIRGDFCPIFRFSVGLAVLVASIAWTPAFAGQESPVLAAQVASGAIPAVTERLPRQALQVQPLAVIGRYGGTLRTGMRGGRKGLDGVSILRLAGYEQLFRWNEAWTEAEPNIVLDYQASDDSREYRLRLREGMRWSDGTPFTSADVTFWYELLERGLLRSGDVPPYAREALTEVAADGDHEVVFRFTQPAGLFPLQAAAAFAYPGPAGFPRHWLRQFLPENIPENLHESVLKQAGSEDWGEFLRLKAGFGSDSSEPNHLLRVSWDKGAPATATRISPSPTLWPWMLTGYEPGGPGEPERLIAERNPYYWKVDPAGNQLPYIDRMEFLIVAKTSHIAELLETGLSNFQIRRAPDIRDVAHLLGPDGPLREVRLLDTASNVLPICLNMTHEDPALRSLFADKDFRIALSLGLDRPAIIRTLGLEGNSLVGQVAPRAGSPGYNKRLVEQFTAFDPAEASLLLDMVGLDRRDADGFRLMTDGSRAGFEFHFREDSWRQEEGVAAIAEAWRALGLDIRTRALGRAELEGLRAAGDFDATIGITNGGQATMLAFDSFAPVGTGACYGPKWHRWFLTPESEGAEAPPPAMQVQLDDYRRILQSSDPAEQKRVMARMMERAADEFLMIGVAAEISDVGFVAKALGNVPAFMIYSWTYPTPAPANPTQFYFR